MVGEDNSKVDGEDSNKDGEDSNRDNNKVGEDNSKVDGDNNKAAGDNSKVDGEDNKVDGDSNMAFNKVMANNRCQTSSAPTKNTCWCLPLTKACVWTSLVVAAVASFTSDTGETTKGLK